MKTFWEIVYPLKNMVGGILGFGYSHRNENSDDPSTARYAARLQGMHFQGEISQTSAKAFDDYLENRISSAQSFASIKALEGIKLQDATKKRIDEALKCSQDTENAQDRFNDEMQAIVAFVDKYAASPADVVHYLYAVKSDAEQAIRAQHDKEKKALEALFIDQAFLAQLKVDLGNNPDKRAVDKVKDGMLNALVKSHTDELTAFNATINKPIQQTLETPNIQKTATLALWMENKETADEINQLVEQARKGKPHISAIGSGERDKDSDITDEMLKNLKTIRTRSGRLLENNGEGTFSLNLPHRILCNPLYYLGADNNLRNDIQSLPEAIQRLGYKKISMNLRHPDKEYELKLAREAYAACRNVGFEEKDIKLNTGHKQNIKFSELFAGHEAEKNAIDTHARKLKADRDKLSKSTPDFKNKVKEFHEKAKEEKLAKKEPADDPNKPPTSLASS